MLCLFSIPWSNSDQSVSNLIFSEILTFAYYYKGNAKMSDSVLKYCF